jgi:hypothetical protein
MSQFLDRLLLQLSTPANLVQLLDPPADANHTRLRGLLDATFEFDFATIHEVRDVHVIGTELERPIAPLRRTIGTWTQTTPSYSRTDVRYERAESDGPIWLDLVATLGLTLLLEVDSGALASVVSREIEGFNTLAEFQARFKFIDLNAFMAQVGVATFEELRARHRYVLSDIQLQQPPPFNPADAGNLHSFTLGVAMLARDTLDVGAGLRDAKTARNTMETALAFTAGNDVARARTPFAPIVIFPDAAVAGPPLTAAAVQQVFAAEHVLALFVTPA